MNLLSSLKKTIVKFLKNFLSIFILILSLPIFFPEKVHFYILNFICGLVLLFISFYINSFLRTKIENFVVLPKINTLYLFMSFFIAIFIHQTNEISSQNETLNNIKNQTITNTKQIENLTPKTITKEYFEKNKANIISNLQEAKTQKNFNLFFKDIAPYLAFNDPIIEELNKSTTKQYKEHQKDILINQINELPNTEENFKKILEHYKKLLSLEPTSERFKYEVTQYESKVKSIEDSRARKLLILKQFTPTGKHIFLYSVVKNIMKDPDSFEHINSTYEDKGDYIIVTMQFRGKNSFGAKIIDSISGKFKLTGELIEMH